MKVKIITISIITLMTVSLLGASVANAQTNTSLMSPIPSNQINTSETRLKLRMLMQEHAVLTGDTMIARYNSRPDFETARTMFNQNTDATAAIIENLYGADIRRNFLTLWHQHNDLYIKYADALRSGNRDEQNKVKIELDTFIAHITALFSSRLQGTSKEQLMNVFRDHVYFTRLVIENHAAKDFQNEYMNKHTAFEHAATMGDILSGISWNY